MNSRRCVTALFTAFVLAAMPARGAPTGHSDVEGLRAYRDGRFEDAIAILSAELAAAPLPSTAYTLGLAYEKQGDLVKAAECQRKATELELPAAPEEAALEDRARQRAAARLLELKQRVPLLTVSLKEPNTGAVVVLLDGVELADGTIGHGIPANPGEHVLEARCRDLRGQKRVQLRLTEGARESFSLELNCAEAETALPNPAALTPPPSPPAEPELDDRRWGPLEWTGVGMAGLGLASLGVGLGFLLSALDKKDQYESHCDAAHRCDPEWVPMTQDAARQGRYATGFAVGGGALLLGGAALFAQAQYDLFGSGSRAVSLSLAPTADAWEAGFLQRF